MSDLINIFTQSENPPTSLDGWENVTWENNPDIMKAHGWRKKSAQPEKAEGYERVSAIAIEGDGTVCDWQVTDRLLSEIQQEQALADLQANADRYKWENRTIIFLRRIGAIEPEANSAPANIDRIIEEQLYALSQDMARSAEYVAMVTRASVLREQVERYGGTMATIQWHDGVSA